MGAPTGKALGGFIAGFSLAIFLFSLVIYINATPHLETMQSTYELNETIYAATHSEWFGMGLGLLDGINAVGVFVPGAAYAGDVKELLITTKDMSESVKGTLGLLIAITRAAVYLMVGSLIAFMLGTMIAMKPAQKVIVQTAPQSVYCSECGAQNQPNSKYCSSCGMEV